jgi:aspartate kinase
MTETAHETVPEIASDEHAPHAGTIVMKFGGSSVEGPERLKTVAKRIVAARESGSRVIAVLSAMGNTTDDLLELARQVSATPDPRELDMLISVGERISCALAAMAIKDLGHEAISLTGSQAGIVTDTSHTKAKIVEVRAHRIHEALDDGKIVLVAGFQGVSTGREITTLGRGGSDTTAVALAAALGAESCEIFTDVAGVYSADPRIIANAYKLPIVTYEEMLEMSASGAKVMALRSVEFARNHGVRLHVRSTFSDAEGTWIQKEDEQLLEKAIISGVTHDTSEAKLTIRGVPDRPGVAARVFRALADAGVNIDMIVQNVSAEGLTDISFTAPKTDLAAAEPILAAACKDFDAAGFSQDSDIAKVSLIGAGMRSHPGVAADMFEALAEAGINLEIISTSSIRISCVVRAADVENAVRAVHDRFQLVVEARANA